MQDIRAQCDVKLIENIQTYSVSMHDNPSQ